MAKFNHGVFTKTKGKLGGVVFQQYEGMQIGKEYQPNVKNPNTYLQTESRAKFKLASAVTSLLFPYLQPVIKANGIDYSRFQRGDILKRLYAVTGIDDQASTIQANLLSMPVFRTATQIGLVLNVASNTYNNHTVTATYGYTGERIGQGTLTPVCALYMFDNNGGTSVIVGGTVTTSLTGFTVSFTLPDGFEGSYVVMAYMTDELQSTTGIGYGDIVGAEQDIIASLSTAERLAETLGLSNLLTTSGYVVS